MEGDKDEWLLALWTSAPSGGWLNSCRRICCCSRTWAMDPFLARSLTSLNFLCLIGLLPFTVNPFISPFWESPDLGLWGADLGILLTAGIGRGSGTLDTGMGGRQACLWGRRAFFEPDFWIRAGDENWWFIGAGLPPKGVGREFCWIGGVLGEPGSGGNLLPVDGFLSKCPPMQGGEGDAEEKCGDDGVEPKLLF